MTVRYLCERLGLEALSMPDGDREITGGYAGDLLSWVMGRASPGDVWVTIMSNINVVAVAALADTSCVIIAENAEADTAMINKAEAQGINLLRSKKKTFELCAEISGLL